VRAQVDARHKLCSVSHMDLRKGRPVGSKRRWGYFVWVGAALMLAVPEFTAAISHGALGFVTASETIGHLERYHNWIELGVIGALVLIVYSLFKVSFQAAGEPSPVEGKATRTTGGRLTFHPTRTSNAKTPKDFGDENAHLIFAVCAVVSALLVAFAGWASVNWWDDPRRFHASFVIYVSVAVLWFVGPSLVAFFWGADVPYPTMVRTVKNLSDWFEKQTWPWSLGPKLGWLVTFVILWGLVILFVHLTLYPYPDITHVIDPTG
jgi:hypothetical protein